MTASARGTAFPPVTVRARGDQVATADEVTVWIGLDVGKEEHFADVLDDNGDPLFARSIGNDEAALDELLGQAIEHGVAGLVIDQPGSIAQLAVAARKNVPVAYVPGLVMRRAADLYSGEAKTDCRDAFVIADTARRRRPGLTVVEPTADRSGRAVRVELFSGAPLSARTYEDHVELGAWWRAWPERWWKTQVEPGVDQRKSTALLGHRCGHPEQWAGDRRRDDPAGEVRAEGHANEGVGEVLDDPELTTRKEEAIERPSDEAFDCD
jgi:Transposase